MTTEGKKLDAGKRRFTLLPWSVVGEVVDVLEFGARKYAVDNWMDVPNGEQRYIDAALRHIAADLHGEDVDPESGLPHLAHAICSIMFARWFQRQGRVSKEKT